VRSFRHFTVIDWSGEAVARPKGLAVAHAVAGRSAPALVHRDGGWSREAILAEIVRHAEAGSDLLIGVDLSPGLPHVDRGGYFPGFADAPRDARTLWRMVDDLSTDSPHLSAAGFLAHPDIHLHFRHQAGTGTAFEGGRGRLRACEEEQRRVGLSPSSCFNLIGAAQVGKSSLTGMRVLHRLAGRVPVWPFDPVPETGPLIVEIYTTIAARDAGIARGRSKMRDRASLDAALANLGSNAPSPLPRYDDHSTDAILTAAWLRIAADRPALWSPSALTPTIARTEGWTFGVP
jgi:hypothetical protein